MSHKHEWGLWSLAWGRSVYTLKSVGWVHSLWKKSFPQFENKNILRLFTAKVYFQDVTLIWYPLMSKPFWDVNFFLLKCETHIHLFYVIILNSVSFSMSSSENWLFFTIICQRIFISIPKRERSHFEMCVMREHKMGSVKPSAGSMYMHDARFETEQQSAVSWSMEVGRFRRAQHLDLLREQDLDGHNTILVYGESTIRKDKAYCRILVCEGARFERAHYLGLWGSKMWKGTTLSWSTEGARFGRAQHYLGLRREQDLDGHIILVYGGSNTWFGTTSYWSMEGASNGLAQHHLSMQGARFR